MLNEYSVVILLGVLIGVSLIFWRRQKGKKRYTASRYEYGLDESHGSPPRMIFTDRDARRRRDLRSYGYTGRTNSELDGLNRKLTDSLKPDEIRRRVRERESSGLPTGQLRAAARNRGIDLDS